MRGGEFLSRATAKALGFEAVWRNVETLTPFGQAARARLQPFLPEQRSALEAELERVEHARAQLQAETQATTALMRQLEEFKDIRRSLERAQSGTALDVVELFEIKRFLQLLKGVAESASISSWPGSEDMVPDYPESLAQALDPAGVDEPSFYIDENFSPVLGRIRSLKRRCERRLGAEQRRLRREVEAELGLPVGLEGEVVLRRNDQALERALRTPQLILEQETTSHCFFSPRPSPAALVLEQRGRQLRERESRVEHSVRQRLSQTVASHARHLHQSIDRIARLDLLLAKARLGQRWNCVRPQLAVDEGIDMVEGRHPLVEESIRREGRAYTAVSLRVEQGVTVLTGPNMGGKTVTLQTVGLLICMAQYGLLVPAHSLRFSPRSFIFYVAAEGKPRIGLSAFAVEVEAVSALLVRRNGAGLALIDEFARTTNPREGRALAAALVAELQATPLVTLFATHFDGLSELTGARHYQVRGLGTMRQVPAGEAGLAYLYQYMDYRLERVEGKRAVPRDALLVGRILGLDEQLLRTAERFLEGER